VGQSLREALSKAMAKDEGPGDEPAPEPETSAADVEAPEPAEGAEPEVATEEPKAQSALDARARDEGGRFAKEAKRPGKEPTADTAADPAKATGQQPAPAPKVAAAPVAPAAPTAVAGGDPALKPPSSWKPLAREKWGELPRWAQEEASRTEKEAQKVMLRDAGNQRIVNAVAQTLGPYEQMIRAEGAEPLAAVGALLKQSHMMRYGAPAQKAAFIDQLIETHQVPVDAAWVAKMIQRHRVDINALADVLDGKGAAPGQTQAAPPAPVFDPAAMERQILEKVQQNFQQQQWATMQAQESANVETFISGQEFGDTVRQEMADLLEMHARTGRSLSLQQAYEKAVQNHPDLAPVLQQRREAEAAKAKLASTQRARVASSSVKTQPAGAPPPAKKPGLRGALEESWAQLEDQR
jgi:hypothetical protein